MESFTIKAKFLSPKGFFSRLWKRDRYGTITLQPDNKMTMTGYDKVYAALDVGGFYAQFEGDGVEYLNVQMNEDGEDVYRFAVYREDAYKFFAWLIRQEVCHFGLNMLRQDEDAFREHLEGPVMKQLREWQLEDDKRIRRPADDLFWDGVDEKLRQWIIADCAIVHMANGVEIQELGGMPASDPMGREYGRQIMRDSWEINSRPELIETIMDMAGQNLLWQLQRTIQNAGWGYLAGYLTLRETLNVILTAGKRLQNVTRSWEDFGKAYLRSYSTYMGDTGEDYEQREQAFKQLLMAEDSPYRKVPFDMELCKSW